MAIKFFNIKSKEVRVAESEPHISAMWASSDRGPNVSQGQDFGWRLAPEVVVEMKKIKQNMQKLLEIANRYNLSLEDVGEKEILQYISSQTAADDAPLAAEADYTDEYDQEIKRLEREEAKKNEPKPEPVQAPTPEPAPVSTTTTTVEPEVTTTVEPDSVEPPAKKKTEPKN